MSGGHFQYDQYKIGYIADEVKQLILDNDSTEKDEYGYEKGRHYPPEVIARFKIAYLSLREAQIAAQRIDWLVSGDDGPDTFLKRWQEDMNNLYKEARECPL